MVQRSRARKRRKLPSKRDIQLHVRRHQRQLRVLYRLMGDIEKKRDSIVVGPGGLPDNQSAAMIVDLLNDFWLRAQLLVTTILACIAIYNGISATVDAINTPGVPDATKEQLNENLSGMIEDAAKLGCP